MSVEALEKRVAELESEVSRLRFELAQSKGLVSGRTAPENRARFVGIHANSPTFDSMVRYMEERSQREREEAEREAEQDEEEA